MSERIRSFISQITGLSPTIRASAARYDGGNTLRNEARITSSDAMKNATTTIFIGRSSSPNAATAGASSSGNPGGYTRGPTAGFSGL